MEIINLLPIDIKNKFESASIIDKSFIKKDSDDYFNDILLRSSSNFLYILVADDCKTKAEICDEFLFASMNLLNSEYSNSLVYIKHHSKLTEASDFFS